MKAGRVMLLAVLALMLALGGAALAEGFSVEPVGDKLVYVDYGSTVTLEVAVTGSDDYTCQWYVDVRDPEIDAYSREIMPAETGLSIETAPITYRSFYSCVVRDVGGGQAVTVNFEQRVENGFTAETVGPLVQRSAVGAAKTLRVRAACDTGSLHYAWTEGYGDEEGNYNETALDFDGPECVIASYSDPRDYRCLVTDDYGNFKYLTYELATAVPIEADVKQSVTASIGTEEPCLCFVPQKTNFYYFAAMSDQDTYGYICDEDNNPLEGSSNGGLGQNFCVGCELEAGKTYYLQAGCYNDITQSFDVLVSDGRRYPVVTTQNETYSRVKPGTVETLKVEGSSDYGPVAYQWYESLGITSSGYSMDTMPSERTDTFVTPEINALKYYMCEVTDCFGQKASVQFDFLIDSGFKAEQVGARDRYVQPGEPQTLEIRASSYDNNIKYQWYGYFPNEYGYDEKQLIEDVTGPALEIPSVDRHCRYDCVVSDGYGIERNFWFFLHIDNHFTVEDPDNDVFYVAPGEDLNLSVQASSTVGTLSYEWYKGYASDQAIEGAVTDTLTLRDVRESADYLCIIRDGYGLDAYRNFFVRIDNGIAIPETKVERYVPVGETTELTARAYCDDGELTYSWSGSRYNAEEGRFESFEVDADGPTLTTVPIDVLTRYTCVIRDKYNDGGSIFYTLYADSGLTAEAVGPTEFVHPYGETQTLRVKAACKQGKISYRWYASYYDVEKEEWESVKGEPSDSPTFDVTGSMGRGYVECTVSDEYGRSIEIVYHFTLDIGLKAEAVGDQVRFIQSGDSATLKVKAETRVGELSYEWFYWDLDDEPFGKGETTLVSEPLKKTTQITCRVRGPYNMRQDVRFTCVVIGPELETDRDITVNMPDAQTNDVCYSFTPAVSGYYTLESFGEIDTWCRLFDQDFNILEEDDDRGETYENFRLTYPLKAGRTYYYDVSSSDDPPVSFTVRLSMASAETQKCELRLNLRVGQTIVLPDKLDGDRDYLFDRVENINPDVIRADGRTITALKPGSAALLLPYTYEELEYDAVTLLFFVTDEPVVTLPDGLTRLEAETFAGDDGLRYVVLGENVAYIEKNAFNGSGLRQIVVPGYDTTFGGGSLRGVSGITVLCRKGSRAESYARRMELDYAYLP